MTEGYIDTRGKQYLAIAICDRCSRKFPLEELYRDPNCPGLRVCREDLDTLDPWREPPRTPETLQLRFPRPDVELD